MVKLFDCFMFNNEEDLLKLRITNGFQYVEKFIIVESRETHSGVNKPLFSDNLKDFFEIYKTKIVHYIVEKFPKNIKNYPMSLINYVKKNRPNKEFWNWLREGYQRSIITKYKNFASYDDIFLVSDIDEIPNYEKFHNDILNNRNNILNEIINYTLPTYIFNIHYKLDNYIPFCAFTCPIRLLNENNITSIRFNNGPLKIVDGYFVHLNRFLKPKQLMFKEISIAEANKVDISIDDFKKMRKNILQNMLSGTYNGTKMIYGNYTMPKNINIISKFFLLDSEEIKKYLEKINDKTVDFEEIYNEINNL